MPDATQRGPTTALSRKTVSLLSIDTLFGIYREGKYSRVHYGIIKRKGARNVIEYPKVDKITAHAVSGHKRIKKILASAVVAAGLVGAVALWGTDAAKASASPSGNLSNTTQGALLFVPATQSGERVAYHQSHRSHYSHSSHRSHYSSRW